MMNIITHMNDSIPVGADWLFTGEKFNNQTGVFIKDEYGKGRIKLYIGTDSKPHFQILERL